MLSFLNSPFPCTIGQRSNIFTAFFIGLFVAIFLLIFEPFGIQESKESFRTSRSVGFGIVSFLVLLFFYFIVPKLFPRFYNEKTYTLGKDIISSAMMILLIGIANGVYAHFVLPEQALVGMFIMIGQTFLIGIFPLTFLSLFQYNRMLRSNLQSSQDIKIPEESAAIKAQNRDLYYLISDGQEKAEVTLGDFLYLESDGNYVSLYQYKDGTSTKSMYRATIKSIESENSYHNVIRCHRSFIVNLDHVVDVKGNAQGLKLTLKNCEELVPVSRKYISTVKDYFNSQ